MAGPLLAATSALVGARRRPAPPRQTERRLEAAYPARPAPTSSGGVGDVVDAEVLWEELDGSTTSWAESPSPFSFARSPADLVRSYGARPTPAPGRFVDLLAY